MAKYNNISSLRSALEDVLINAVDGMTGRIEKQVDLAVMDYYIDYTPKMYERTGTLSYAPTHTDATPYENGVVAQVYMDLGLTYAGPWTMEKVIEAADALTHGGYKGGDGVAIWSRPMDEVTVNSRAMWKDSLKEAGLDVK